MKRDGDLRWGFKEMRRYMLPYILFTLLSFIVKYIDTLEPVFSGRIIDNLTALDKNGFLYNLLLLFLLLFANLLLSMVITWYRTKWNNKVSKEVELKYFSRLFTSSEIYLKKRDNDEIKNIILGDLSVLISFYTAQLPDLLLVLFSLVIIGSRLYFVSISLFFIVIGLSFFPLVVNYFFGKIFKEQTELERQFQDQYLGIVKEFVDGRREIKINGFLYFFARCYEAVISRGFGLVLRGTKINFSSSILLYVVNSGSNILIYLILGYMVLSGEITIGELVTMQLFAIQLKGIVVSLSSTYPKFMVSKVSIERIRKSLNAGNESIISKKEDGKISVKIKDFSFKYSDNSKEVFSSFSASFEGPSLVLLKGKNGSGKSTLLYSLANSFPKGAVYQGAIEIEGKIAYLVQEPLLLNMSIRDNIEFGHHLLAERLDEIVNLVDLSSVISSLPNGIDSVLGADTDLSKGQVKRIALARALASSADILLIDEIEANADDIFLERVKEILFTLSRESLVIMVSHSTLFDTMANKIITME